jgi:hypothetical protein
MELLDEFEFEFESESENSSLESSISFSSPSLVCFLSSLIKCHVG